MLSRAIFSPQMLLKPLISSLAYWTALLWYLSEQGISPLSTVSDGGRAIQEAVSQVHGQEHHQRDVWHLFHVAAQVQGRLDRAVKAAQARLPALQRSEQRRPLRKLDEVFLAGYHE